MEFENNFENFMFFYLHRNVTELYRLVGMVGMCKMGGAPLFQDKQPAS